MLINGRKNTMVNYILDWTEYDPFENQQKKDDYHYWEEDKDEERRKDENR